MSELDIVNGHSLEEIRASLEEAVAWCTARMALGSNVDLLRSPELRPWTLAKSRKQAVDWTVNNRRSLLRMMPVTKTGKWKGRLLIHEPDVTLWERWSESQSYGYVDATDAPPWDTWIAWIEEHDPSRTGAPLRYLLSWVPDYYVPIVDDAVDVSTASAIRWLDSDPCVLRGLLSDIDVT